MTFYEEINWFDVAFLIFAIAWVAILVIKFGLFFDIPTCRCPVEVCNCECGL